MERQIKYGDKILDDRFILGKLLLETNFRGYVVEKTNKWGYSLYKVDHRSDIKPDALYLIVEDQTEIIIENRYERMLRILNALKDHIALIKDKNYGLCGLLKDLSDGDILKPKDYDIMIQHLRHRFGIPEKNIATYIWDRGNAKPRLKWIETEIEIFKKAIEDNKNEKD